MRHAIRTLALTGLLALIAVPCGGCATIVGTAVSPITGGVDLAERYLSPVKMGGRGQAWATPFVFIGGMVAGPFVALYNGINHDISVFESFDRYWNEYPEIFKPFEMINKQSRL